MIRPPDCRSGHPAIAPPYVDPLVSSSQNAAPVDSPAPPLRCQAGPTLNPVRIYPRRSLWPNPRYVARSLRKALIILLVMPRVKFRALECVLGYLKDIMVLVRPSHRVGDWRVATEQYLPPPWSQIPARRPNHSLTQKVH